MDEDRLKAELVGALQQMSNQLWETVILAIRVQDPTVKKYELVPLFKDADGRNMVLFLRADPALDATLHQFLFGQKQERSVNEIMLKATRDDYINAELVVRYTFVY